MANLNWSEKVNAGYSNSHVTHAMPMAQDVVSEQRRSHNQSYAANNCRFPNWRRLNTHKHHQPPQPTQRHTGKPPTLLRLDSAGESVEDFPLSPIHGPSSFEPSSNARTTNSFLGNILNKVGYPLHPPIGRTNLARPDKRHQGDINLDRLVDKFNSSCEMDPKLPEHHRHKMGNQEVNHIPKQRPPMQPSKLMPAMTFNGGPYITCPSQDNSPRTFPAYYRFLNFVHFHPYNNAMLMGRTHYSPPLLSQPRHAWIGRTQSQHHPPHKHCNAGGKKLPYHSREFKQFCGGQSQNKGNMMQAKPAMSHQCDHQNSATSPKATSPHGITGSTASDLCGSKTVPANSFLIHHDDNKSHPSRTLPVHSDHCQQSSVQSCQNGIPRAALSQSMSTNTCSNSDLSKVQLNQEGNTCRPTIEQTHESSTLALSKSLCSQLKLSSPSLNAAKSKQKVDEECNSKPTTNCDDVTKSISEQNSQHADNKPNDTSNSSKQVHSSIAYLLGDYIDNPAAACSNDSDFSEDDADEDLSDEIDSDSIKLLESFQTCDPYNPMYGWKCLPSESRCKDQLTTHETADNGNIRDSTSTFNDSGVSVIEQSSDGVASSSASHSSSDGDESDESFESSDDEWSHDSGCDEEEQRIWESLSRCDDPYDPMGGWRLNAKQCAASSTTPCKSSPIIPDVVLNNNADPTLKEPASLKSNLQPLPLQQNTCADDNLSSKRHPTVSFILGADDYSDSDSADEEDDDDNETSDIKNIDSSAKYEDLWQSFQSSSDPYNPMNGWNCQSPSLLHRSASSPSELCKSGDEEEDEPTKPSSPKGHADGMLLTPPRVPSNVSLIQSSSTGCLKTVWKKAAQRDKEKKARKVSFCTDPVVISPEVPMWEEEYMEARRGHWEEFARDRCRFQRRIRDAERTIAPCFTPAHRVKVFQKLCAYT